jgi:hypothetical protein
MSIEKPPFLKPIDGGCYYYWDYFDWFTSVKNCLLSSSVVYLNWLTPAKFNLFI